MASSAPSAAPSEPCAQTEVVAIAESPQQAARDGRRLHPVAVALAVLAVLLGGLWLGYDASPPAGPADLVPALPLEAGPTSSGETLAASEAALDAAAPARLPVDDDAPAPPVLAPAELGVSIQDLDPSLEVRLEVHDLLFQQPVHTSVHTGEQVYGGLSVPLAHQGEVQVVARVGQRVGVSDPVVLAPGGRTEVVLVLRGAPSGAEAFTVLGLLDFASEDHPWFRDHSLELSFRIEDPSSPRHLKDIHFLRDAELAREPDPSARRRFRTAPMPPGKYGVHLRGLGRVHVFELVEDAQFVVVAVPRMGRARVRLVDGTGQTIEAPRAIWTRLDGRRASAWVTPAWHAERGELTAELLPGRWRFDTGLEQYHPRQLSAEIPSGDVPFEWTLERAYRVELRAVAPDGGARLPASWWHGAKLEPTGGSGRLLSTRVPMARGGGASRAEFTVSAPGMYRVVFGELQGYDLPLQVFVDVRDDFTPVVEFDVRAPAAATRGSKSGEK